MKRKQHLSPPSVISPERRRRRTRGAAAGIGFARGWKCIFLDCCCRLFLLGSFTQFNNIQMDWDNVNISYQMRIFSVAQPLRNLDAKNLILSPLVVWFCGSADNVRTFKMSTERDVSKRNYTKLIQYVCVKLSVC